MHVRLHTRVTRVTDEDEHVSAGTTRRPLLRFAAGGGALATVGIGARLTLHRNSDDDPAGNDGDGTLTLSTHAETDVQTLELPLGDQFLPSAGGRRWESRRLPTSTHSMVAFTWGAAAQAPALYIRSRTAGAWRDWLRVPRLHASTDEESGADAAVVGTDLMWIGRADGIQVRAEGRRPADLTLVLLYPARRVTDPLLGRPTTARTDGTGDDGSGTAEARAPRPDLVTREEWGANESLRDGRPTYIRTIKQVHVHHTVNSNTYSRADVPALLRGMYAYHTQTLGWSDIGYNFLVDRFGRGWVGRAGGAAKLVRGAHTLGFNAESTGISAIGNYDTVMPSEVTLNAIAAIAAWKLDRFHRNPRAHIEVESEGSDQYRSGRTVRLPVIDGHRDTNDTACPGKNLYEALPKVRRRAARIIGSAQQTTVLVDRAASIAGTARLAELLRANPGAYRPDDATVLYHWHRDGRPIRGAREQAYQIRPWDVGHRVTCQVELRKRGLEPVLQSTEPVGPVTAEPTLAVTTSSRRRAARIEVTVTAPPDVRAQPSGTVVVKVGDRTKTVRLENAAAVVRFGGHRGLSPGRYAVTVRYEGDRAFTAATGEATVRTA